MDDTFRGRVRDRIAYNIVTFALNHIATPWYRAMIAGSIHLGLLKAQELERAGQSPAADATDTRRMGAS